MAKKKIVKDALIEEENIKKSKNLETKKDAKSEEHIKSYNEEKKESSLKTTMRELKKVSWPSFKEVMKYSLAVVILCLFLVGFFELVQLLATYIKWVFR